MNPESAGILKAFTEYGIALVGLVFVSKFLMWLIKYILERNKEKEDCYIKMMTGDLKNLAEAMVVLTKTVNDFSDNVGEAHKYQREEHVKFGEGQVKTNEILNGIAEAVGRINGYKH
jgi:hypothetical protein